MSKHKIIGSSLPNMPWQDKPAGCNDPMWRFDGNPIITGQPIPCSQAVYNSAVVPWGDKYIGVFRVEYKNRHSFLHLGRSDDAINWTIYPQKLPLGTADPEVPELLNAIDPRVVKIDDWYYITWCNYVHGPMIGVARTQDFEKFEQYENALLPYNRNAVLFPRKFDGEFAMLSRPSDAGHTAFGDIFVSHSPDMTYWGKHRHVMGRGDNWWDSVKIGAGPIPIETTAGWLLIYHGVLETCNGFVYSIGTALLDIEKPYKVIARAKNYAMCPQENYETVGFVPSVCFPCAALCDADTGRIAIYYGAADTHVALAFADVDELVQFTLDNNCEK